MTTPAHFVSLAVTSARLLPWLQAALAADDTAPALRDAALAWGRAWEQAGVDLLDLSRVGKVSPDPVQQATRDLYREACKVLPEHNAALMAAASVALGPPPLAALRYLCEQAATSLPADNPALQAARAIVKAATR